MGAAGFWAALLFGTALPFFLFIGLLWPKRFVLHCACQGAVVGWRLTCVPEMCSSALLTHPASVRQLRGAHALLYACGSAAGLPAAALLRAHDAVLEAQCWGVLSVLLFMLGIALPLVTTACWQYRDWELWQQQEQQRGAGRPPAWPARGAAEGVLRAGALALLLVRLVAAVWDIALQFAAPGR